MYAAKPGYRSGGPGGSEAFLEVQERGAEWELLREVGEWRLRYLPDTHEVVLVKCVEGAEDEAVYSELLS